MYYWFFNKNREGNLKNIIPNLLSLSRIPLGILFFFTFISDSFGYIFPLIILVISMITDFFDGFLARKYDVVSEHGKWFDPVSDFLFYFTVYLSFLLKAVMPLLLFILYLLREIIIYSIIRPLYVRKKLEVGAKLPGKIKTVLYGVGVIIILLLCIFRERMIIHEAFFATSSLMILWVLVSYSLVSLYWYIKVFFKKA